MKRGDNITELPIWTECPVRFPSDYIVRRGVVEGPERGEKFIAICYEQDGETKLYVIVTETWKEPMKPEDLVERIFKPMMANLVGARLYKESPANDIGQYTRRKLEGSLSAADRRWKARYDELNAYSLELAA